jgi:hypothetical protein
LHALPISSGLSGSRSRSGLGRSSDMRTKVTARYDGIKDPWHDIAQRRADSRVFLAFLK